MTVAIGVLCRDGVVLGVDAELTVDNGKKPKPKIHTFFECLAGGYNVVAACAGHADSADRAQEDIAEELVKFGNRTPAVREIRAAIETALARFYSLHIDPLPEPERYDMDFSLLLAIRVGRNSRLFRTNRAQVVEHASGWWSIGAGKEFADYLLGTFLEHRPSVELAAQVVAYIIEKTERHVGGVGLATDVHTVHDNGEHWSLMGDDIDRISKTYDAFFSSLKYVLRRADARSYTEDDDLSKWLGFLGDNIKAIRKTHKDRLKKREEFNP